MSLEPIIDRLSEFSIFGGIAAGSLSQLNDLFEEQRYEAGAKLIDEGSYGNRLYVIAAGRVEVSMHCDRPDGSRELALARLGVGDTFGEMELIDTQQRSATVTALRPTQTVELTNMALLQVFQRDPEAFRMLMMNLARDLSRRLRACGQRLAQLVATGELPPAAEGH